MKASCAGNRLLSPMSTSTRGTTDGAGQRDLSLVRGRSVQLRFSGTAPALQPDPSWPGERNVFLVQSALIADDISHEASHP